MFCGAVSVTDKDRRQEDAKGVGIGPLALHLYAMVCGATIPVVVHLDC